MSEPKLDGWNHRVMHHRKKNPLREKNLPEYNEWYAIHEVYYDENGNPHSWTSDPVDVLSESVEDIRWTLEKMLGALDKPILDYKEDDE